MADVNKPNQSPKDTGLFRSRAAPRKGLHRRATEPLPRFFNRLGVAIYGTEWNESAIQKALNSEVSERTACSNLDCALLVINQIVCSLASGRLKAEVKLSVKWIPIDDEPEDSDHFSTDNLSAEKSVRDFALRYNLPTQHDVETHPELKRFSIKRSFWQDNDVGSNVDWSTGHACIDDVHFEEEDRETVDSRTVSERWDGVKVPACLLHICDPDRALSRLFAGESVPEQEWMERYKIYRKATHLEALAAGWRYLAINKRDAQISERRLARVMQDYLLAQGFNGISNLQQQEQIESGLRSIAHNMIQQFENGERNSSVLVSSNPRRREGG